MFIFALVYFSKLLKYRPTSILSNTKGEYFVKNPSPWICPDLRFSEFAKINLVINSASSLDRIRTIVGLSMLIPRRDTFFKTFCAAPPF